MNEDRSRGIGNAVIGSLLGALVGISATELGLPNAAKIPFNVLLPCVILGAIVAAVWGLRPLAGLAAVLVTLLAVLIYTPATGALTRALVRADPEKIRPDAIVVLSGGVNSDGTMGNVTLDRVLSGIQLMRRFPGVPLLISREMIRSRGRTLTDSADLASFLSLMPTGAPVYFADSTTSTLDEAKRIREIAGARGWRRIMLVTSPQHSKRACGTFESQGLMVACVPAIARSGPIRMNGTIDDNLGLFRSWIYEMAGTLKDRTAGRLSSPNSIRLR